jgi:hypothetical protein
MGRPNAIKPDKPAGDRTMLKNFEDVQKYGKDNMDLTMKAWGQMSKSIEKAMEIQTAYAKSAYEGFVAQATKMGELCADLAKETYKPFESFTSKTMPPK